MKTENRAGDTEDEKRRIADGIVQDAEREAEKIISEAEQAKIDRIKASRAQAERLLKEAEQKAGERVESISRHAESSVAVGTRRAELKSREAFLRRAGSRATSQMATLIGKPGYRDILTWWIAEAAAGLNAEEAVVNASAGERALIDDGVLREAARQAQEFTGRKPVLKVSTDPPLPEQGVVLFASDGLTAYDNRITTRMLRYKSEIRKIVYEGLTRE